MKKLFLILALPLFFTACSSNESGAQKAVLDVLIEPNSAQFGEFTIFRTSFDFNIKVACLTVNSKNKLGGYTGKKQATLVKENGTWKFIENMELLPISHEVCVKLLKESFSS